MQVNFNLVQGISGYVCNFLIGISFDFSKVKFNRDVPDKRFNYRAPKGTERVTP